MTAMDAIRTVVTVLEMNIPNTARAKGIVIS